LVLWASAWVYDPGEDYKGEPQMAEWIKCIHGTTGATIYLNRALATCVIANKDRELTNVLFGSAGSEGVNIKEPAEQFLQAEKFT
jgi:hypothetical protein